MAKANPNVIQCIVIFRQQRLLSFQNEHLFVFYDKQSTQNHKENVSLMNEVFWTRR